MRFSPLFQRILFTLIFSMSSFSNISAADWNAIVPNLQSNDVSVIDLASPFPSVTTVPYQASVTLGKSAITPDGTTAYITNNPSPGIAASVIPYYFIGEIFGPPINLELDGNLGELPGFIAITPDGTKAYVGCIGSHDVWVIDLLNNVVAACIKQGLNNSGTPLGVAITPDGKTVYVTDGISNIVTIDTATNLVTASIPSNSSPVAIAIVPDGTLALIVNKPLLGSNFVTPLNIPSNTLGATITVGKGPNDITVTADGKTAYVVSQNTSTLTPIDIPTLTALAPINVGGSPIGVDITPDDKTVLVAVTNGNVNNGVVVPVDRSTGTIGTSITVGVNPGGVTITPDQAPIAAFAVLIDPCSLEVVFDGSISSSQVGTIVNYDWDFGDGTQLSTDTPIVTHAYSSVGSFNVRLTVTNSAGTSTTQVYTGQTLTRNGGPNATTSQTIELVVPTVFPPENFRGRQCQKIFNHTQFSCYNVLRWSKPTTGDKPAKYEIYRDEALTQFVGSVSAKHPRIFIDRKLQRGVYSYFIVSVNNAGAKSCPVSAKVDEYKRKRGCASHSSDE